MARSDEGGRGGKLGRSETVTVRLDPKMRYLAELAARKQRRTLSSFVEIAVETALNKLSLDGFQTFGSVAPAIWDIDESDRFAKLALRAPDLLTPVQQIMWRLVCENGYFWRGRFDGPLREWTWEIHKDSLRFDMLRKKFGLIREVALGQEEEGALPGWKKYADTRDDDDDEVGF